MTCGFIAPSLGAIALVLSTWIVPPFVQANDFRLSLRIRPRLPDRELAGSPRPTTPRPYITTSPRLLTSRLSGRAGRRSSVTGSKPLGTPFIVPPLTNLHAVTSLKDF